LPKAYSPAEPRLRGTAAWTRGQRPWRGGMPRVDCSGASRVRENRMHGSEREGWKRSLHGHRASPLLYFVATASLWRCRRNERMLQSGNTSLFSPRPFWPFAPGADRSVAPSSAEVAANMPAIDVLRCPRCGNSLGQVVAGMVTSTHEGRTWVITLSSKTSIRCERCGGVWRADDRRSSGHL
jgi:DNA-directed RNA polymerase subunit RPC12/RpoP